MARKILIVGAGQSGLQLAHGLLQHGYQVTLMSARTADEIRDGRVMSTQAMFDAALQHERDLGLSFWEEAPHFDGIGFSLAPDCTPNLLLPSAPSPTALRGGLWLSTGDHGDVDLTALP